MEILSGHKAVNFALLLLGAMLAWGISVKLGLYLIVIRLTHMPPTSDRDLALPTTQYFLHHQTVIGVVALLLVAFIEEAIFRLLPLAIVARFRPTKGAIVTTIVVTSILFGLAHGSPFNLLVQGLDGLALGFIMVKCSDNGYLTIGYLYAVFVHFAYDLGITAFTLYFALQASAPPH